MKKTGIDKASLCRRAKAEGWVKNNGQKQQLISDAVRVATAKSTAKSTLKSTLKSTALEVHNEMDKDDTARLIIAQMSL